MLRRVIKVHILAAYKVDVRGKRALFTVSTGRAQQDTPTLHSLLQKPVEGGVIIITMWLKWQKGGHVFISNGVQQEAFAPLIRAWTLQRESWLFLFSSTSVGSHRCLCSQSELERLEAVSCRCCQLWPLWFPLGTEGRTAARQSPSGSDRQHRRNSRKFQTLTTECLMKVSGFQPLNARADRQS